MNVINVAKQADDHRSNKFTAHTTISIKRNARSCTPPINFWPMHGRYVRSSIGARAPLSISQTLCENYKYKQYRIALEHYATQWYDTLWVNANANAINSRRFHFFFSCFVIFLAAFATIFLACHCPVSLSLSRAVFGHIFFCFVFCATSTKLISGFCFGVASRFLFIHFDSINFNCQQSD